MVASCSRKYECCGVNGESRVEYEVRAPHEPVVTTIGVLRAVWSGEANASARFPRSSDAEEFRIVVLFAATQPLVLSP